MVVVHHINGSFKSRDFHAVIPTQAFQAGVDLFFVISGFVMVYVTSGGECSPVQFIKMRAIRIIPLYWFYTILAALIMVAMPSLFRLNELSARHVGLSLLFIPHHTGVSDYPVVNQGWTLNYEVFFYLLFAMAMAITYHLRACLATVALVSMAAIGQWAHMQNLSLGTADFYFRDIILEFALGMLIAVIFLNGRVDKLKPILSAGLIVFGFCGLFLIHGSRAMTYGIPAAAIVTGGIALENCVRIKIKLLQFIGDASYSIYLVHILPIAILRAVWPLPTTGTANLALFFVLAVTAAVIAGAVSYYLVERRSLRYLRRKLEIPATRRIPEIPGRPA